jgi:serine protease Do
VKLAERPARAASPEKPAVSRRGTAVPLPADPALGLVVRDLDAAVARRMEIPSSVTGVMVVRIDPAGAAFVPAMRRGFVIMEINRQPVGSVADFQRLLAAARTGDALAFYGYDPSVGQRAIVMATVDSR